DNDLALLKARTDAPLEVAVFRSMPKVSRGEAIVVIGFPLHGTLSSFGNVTDGMISALSGFNDDFREYQFSAPIQPGNSGGPLLDRSGHVIGVVSSELVSESAEDVPQNVNFAIKASIVEAFLGAYGVDFSVMPSDESLDVSEIATEAEDHTFLVECWGDPEDY
ncbi:MAG: trypsin-like peptidase domain-containing protein, partial [Alphaproteobacteria bacterium]